MIINSKSMFFCDRMRTLEILVGPSERVGSRSCKVSSLHKLQPRYIHVHHQLILFMIIFRSQREAISSSKQSDVLRLKRREVRCDQSMCEMK
jgi:hypothetical protein